MISGIVRYVALHFGHTLKQGSHRPQTLPPGVATWEVNLSARKVVPRVRWPATGITAHIFCSQAQGCVCIALQLGGDVDQPWLMSKYDVIHKTGNT